MVRILTCEGKKLSKIRKMLSFLITITFIYDKLISFLVRKLNSEKVEKRLKKMYSGVNTC